MLNRHHLLTDTIGFVLFSRLKLELLLIASTNHKTNTFRKKFDNGSDRLITLSPSPYLLVFQVIVFGITSRVAA